jgi:hypothetical protein
MQTWYLRVREERRELRRTLGPEIDEIIRGWRKLRDKELRNFCSSPKLLE